MSNNIEKKANVLLLLMTSWFIIHSLYVTYDGFRPFSGRAEVAIILGNEVMADSSLSPWLKGRVDAAVELYRTGKVQKIFASGGKGSFGVPEGDAMKKYLLSHQVPGKDILVDNHGDNSYLTALDFTRLNDSMHFSSAVVVSSFYHITRCKYILKKLGYKQVKGYRSRTYFRNDAFGLFREFFAFYKYFIRY